MQVTEKPPLAGSLALPKKTAPQLYLWLLIFLSMLVFEAVRFRLFYIKQIAPYFPIAWDQLDGLCLVYRAHYDLVQNWPKMSALTQIAQHGMKGIVVPLLGTISTFAFGPNRWACVLINFLFFVVGQIALIAFTWRKLGRFDCLLALGFFLLSSVHYFWGGSLNDFRLDYAGMICLGLAFLAAWRFLENGRKTDLAASAAAMILCAFTRCIIAFYWLGTSVLFVSAVLAISFFWQSQASFFKTLSKRAALLFVAAFLSVSILCATFWTTFNAYYVKCKVSGEDVMRMHEFGVHDWFARLAYFPNSLLERFILMISVFVGLVFSCLIAKFFFSNTAQLKSKSAHDHFLLIGVLLLICMTLSVIAFATFYSPSPIVISVLTLPMAVIFAALIGKMIKFSHPELYKSTCILVFILSLGFYYKETRNPTNPPHAAIVVAQAVNDVQTCARHIVETRLDKATTLSWLLIHDGLNQGVFRVFWYEEKKELPPDKLEQTDLPAYPAMTWANMQKCLDKADIVVAPIRMPLLAPWQFEYDSLRAMRLYLPKLQKELHGRFTLRLERSLGVNDYDVGSYTRNKVD